jgi:hypothetical protein
MDAALETYLPQASGDRLTPQPGTELALGNKFAPPPSSAYYIIPVGGATPLFLCHF